MSRYDRETNRAITLTKLIKGKAQVNDFWEGYYKCRHHGYRDVVINHVAPQIAAQMEVVFKPRAKEKWVVQLNNGTEIHRFTSEEEIEFSLQDGNEGQLGGVIGPRILCVAEKQDIGDYMITGLHARIIGSYGVACRAWIATGYDDYKHSQSKAYYTCVARDNYGLHALNPITLHFCFGILSANYSWTKDLRINGTEICVQGQCPQMLIDSISGRRVDEIFDIPFIGDAIATIAYSYNDTWQIKFTDETKTLKEWIALGVI